MSDPMATRDNPAPTEPESTSATIDAVLDVVDPKPDESTEVVAQLVERGVVGGDYSPASVVNEDGVADAVEQVEILVARLAEGGLAAPERLDGRRLPSGEQSDEDADGAPGAGEVDHHERRPNPRVGQEVERDESAERTEDEHPNPCRQRHSEGDAFGEVTPQEPRRRDEKEDGEAERGGDDRRDQPVGSNRDEPDGGESETETDDECGAGESVERRDLHGVFTNRCDREDG